MEILRDISHIDIRSLPSEGVSFLVEEPVVWQKPMQEFALACKVLKPLRAEVFLLPQEDACLVRGVLKGKVALACTRCAEDTPVELDLIFDEYETFPHAEQEEEKNPAHATKAYKALHVPAEEAGEDDPETRIHVQDGVYYLDLAGLLWEEFSLALPLNPLCSAECKGICPICGKNRNTALCDCEKDESANPFAVLKGLKINR